MRLLLLFIFAICSFTCAAEEDARQEKINARYLGLVDQVIEGNLASSELTNSLSALATIPDKLLTKARAELMLTAAATQ